MVRSQLSSTNRRLVASAIGYIGRPDRLASFTKPGLTLRGDLGNVRGERNRVALLERLDHLKEGGDAALAVEAPAGIARAADDFHAQPLGGQRGHLAVAMMRDQRLALVGRASDERRKKVLAMPHHQDDGQVGFRERVELLGGDDGTVGPEDEAEVLGPNQRNRLLSPALTPNTPRPQNRHATDPIMLCVPHTSSPTSSSERVGIKRDRDKTHSIVKETVNA